MSYDLKSVSFSKLNTFARNPENFFFRYVLGLKMPPAKAFIQGRSVHSGLESHYIQKVQDRKGLPIDEIVTIYDKTLKAEQETYLQDFEATSDFLPPEYIKNEAETNFTEIREVGIKGLEIYKEEVDPGLQPKEVETKFSLATDRIDITGRIDIIDEQGWIRDHKTSKRAPQSDDAEDDDQLKIYDLAFRTRYGYKPKGYRKDFIVLTKQPKIVSCKADVMTDYRMKELLRNLNSMIQLMELTIERNLWHNWTVEKWAKDPKWNGYWKVSRDLHLYGLDYVIKKYISKDQSAADFVNIGEKVAAEMAA